MDWARLLVYITGTVDQELLLRNKCLAAENHILKAQIKTRVQFSERANCFRKKRFSEARAKRD